MNSTAVILTALPLEYNAVLEHLTETRRLVHPSGTRFDQGRLPGTRWQVALAEVGAGNGMAGLITQQAWEWLRPEVLLFVGVAGGLHPDIALGDVVVATKVYSYHGGKQSHGRLDARPEAWFPAHSLVQAARAALRRQHGIHFKPIAAGEVILNDPDCSLADQIRRHYNDAIAIEMESAGVARAAHLAELRALTIRGISDKVDGKKPIADVSVSQRRAAANAAAAAVATLAELGDYDATEDAGVSSPSPVAASISGSSVRVNDAGGLDTTAGCPALVDVGIDFWGLLRLDWPTASRSPTEPTIGDTPQTPTAAPTFLPATPDQQLDDIFMGVSRAIAKGLGAPGLTTDSLLRPVHWPVEPHWWLLRANLVELMRVRAASAERSPTVDEISRYEEGAQTVLSQLQRISDHPSAGQKRGRTQSEAELHRAAMKGDIMAMYELGRLLMRKSQQHSEPHNAVRRREAELWLSKAFQGGHAHAGLYLGYLLREANRCKEAGQFFADAYRNGCIAAAAAMGLHIRQHPEIYSPVTRPGGTPRVIQKMEVDRQSGEWFAKFVADDRHASFESPHHDANDSHLAKAALEIGEWLHARGEHEEALPWYVRAFLGGQNEAAHRLSLLFREVGCPEQAEHWTDAVAKFGYEPEDSSFTCGVVLFFALLLFIVCVVGGAILIARGLA